MFLKTISMAAICLSGSVFAQDSYFNGVKSETPAQITNTQGGLYQNTPAKPAQTKQQVTIKRTVKKEDSSGYFKGTKGASKTRSLWRNPFKETTIHPRTRVDDYRAEFNASFSVGEVESNGVTTDSEGRYYEAGITTLWDNNVQANISYQHGSYNSKEDKYVGFNTNKIKIRSHFPVMKNWFLGINGSIGHIDTDYKKSDIWKGVKINSWGADLGVNTTVYLYNTNEWKFGFTGEANHFLKVGSSTYTDGTEKYDVGVTLTNRWLRIKAGRRLKSFDLDTVNGEFAHDFNQNYVTIGAAITL